ncbi:MAG: hypothetical protein JKY19_13940, partial [Alcanivoracaceae bacterium]|nr:hypothetical protein [Alcanivoracaceae bacterium]
MNLTKIKKYILPVLLYSAVAYSLFFIYQNQIRVINQKVSAREIDPACDIVMFTTDHCPYCAKAKAYLISQGAQYCERDIEWSEEDNQLFKQLGGKGTPLTVIGQTVIGGFVESRFKSALQKLETNSQVISRSLCENRKPTAENLDLVLLS